MSEFEPPEFEIGVKFPLSPFFDNVYKLPIPINYIKEDGKKNN